MGGGVKGSGRSPPNVLRLVSGGGPLRVPSLGEVFDVVVETVFF
jgi:hypothetical protein